MTLKLNHLHIKTKDPERTAKFYVDMFGAKILTPGPRNGYRLDLLGLHLNVTPFLEDQTREQQYPSLNFAVFPYSAAEWGSAATEEELKARAASVAPQVERILTGGA